eukprot:5069205-Pyramimonas_sp.AAC.2
MSVEELSADLEATNARIAELEAEEKARASEFAQATRGYGVDVRGCGVDVRGCGVDVRGPDVDVKGYGVDVRGYGVDVRGPRAFSHAHVSASTSTP